MKIFKKLGACFLCTCMLLGGCSSKDTHGLDPDKPVTLTLWHYYNGAQKDALDQLVEEFNTTEGKENGVIIDAVAKTSISNIASDLHDSLEKKPSAEAMPNMFMAYQDTAQELMDRKKLVSLETYMSEDDLNAYVAGFLNDGRYFGSDETKLFPVAKASEVMIINKNEWTKFADAENVKETDLETWEGLQKTAERYYTYSGGKAFFSRDAIANYFITGSKQFKDELFTQKKDKTVFSVSDETMRKLWDNYYIPFVKGYYVKNGRFASDDIKTKDVIASVSSTASGTFYPKEVINESGNSEAVEYLVLPVPDFKGTKDTSISQGGGVAITKAGEAKEYGSILFLKWFTDSKRNINFSAQSSYLPVKKDANNYRTWSKTIQKADIKTTKLLEDIMKTSMKEVTKGNLYASKSFTTSYAARKYLENAVNDKAAADQKAVQDLISGGKSREEALQYYLSDDNFDAWMKQVRNDLGAILRGNAE